MLKKWLDLYLLGPLYFLAALKKCGRNLFTLLYFTKLFYPNKIALSDDEAELNYVQLYQTTLNLSKQISNDSIFKTSNNIGLQLGNTIDFVQCLFACSMLGKTIYLLPKDLNPVQIEDICKKNNIEFLITSDRKNKTEQLKSINRETISQWTNQENKTPFIINKKRNSQIILLTSGTTGDPKVIGHKTKTNPPFLLYFNLVRQLNLLRYEKTFIATPFYHSYGLSALIMGLVMGNAIYMSNNNTALHQYKTIEDKAIDFITLVPTQLQRLLPFIQKGNTALKGILTGSAPLPLSVLKQTLKLAGPIVYNLYGSSETGIVTAALPKDLLRYGNTVGKPLWGVHIKIKNQDNKELKPGESGAIWVKNNLGLQRFRKAWIATGDIGYQLPSGHLFITGRVDDMIISGGKNIYPNSLEQLLEQHEAIQQCAVIGIPDDEFGQRLKAFVVLHKPIEKEALHTYVKANAPKALNPKGFVYLKELPVNAIGKIDKKTLQKY